MKPKRKSPEADLQIAVAQYLNLALPKGAIWFAVPNGGTRNLREAVKFKRMGVKAGIPDIIILHQSKAFCIELKSGNGVVSKVQKAMMLALFEAGFVVAVCRSLDEVAAFLQAVGLVPKPWLTRRNLGRAA